MATPPDFYKELSSITKFEIVGPPKETDRQIRVIGRVRTRAASRAWAMQYVAALVRASTSNARWSVDVSRYYFEKDNEVLWAWRVILQAVNVPMESALDEILRVLRLSGRAAAAPKVELEEIPLVFPSSTRNAVINGKGVSNTREKV